MTLLDDYLATHYLDAPQLLAAALLDEAELDTMLRDGLVPAPAYVVHAGKVMSFVFGAMDAPGSKPGRYFHPSQLVWIERARAAASEAGAARHLKQAFCMNFAAALAALNLATWRLADSFDDAGMPIASGLAARTESAWTYFLNGTFALCVANPVTEAQIAYKEVLQEKLALQSENGKKTGYQQQEARELHALIDAYAAAAMPFSPVDYPRSSRKRLVEDLRATMRVTG